MAGAWGNNMLSFLAVGRVRDTVTLASYVNKDADPEEKTMDIFKKLLAAAASKLTPGQRTRLQWNDGSVCCLMDASGENLYCVVTALLSYPERLANQLLYDLVAEAAQIPSLATAGEQELQSTLGPKMKDMVLYYEDPKNFPQWAMGAGASRDTLTSVAQSSAELAAPDGGGRMKLYIGILLVAIIIVVIIGVVMMNNSGATSTVGVPAAAPGGFLVSRIAQSVEGAKVGVVAMS